MALRAAIDTQDSPVHEFNGREKDNGISQPQDARVAKERA
jgi:hypothetical protein